MIPPNIDNIHQFVIRGIIRKDICEDPPVLVLIEDPHLYDHHEIGSFLLGRGVQHWREYKPPRYITRVDIPSGQLYGVTLHHMTFTRYLESSN
jgi:hypothetical protein